MIAGRPVILPSRASCSRRSKSSWCLFSLSPPSSRSCAVSMFSILFVLDSFPSSASSSDFAVLASPTRRLRSVSRRSLFCWSRPEPARSAARESSINS